MVEATAVAPPAPILLVEDDPTTVDVVRAYLEHAGHATAVCRSGGQALDVLRQVSPRCVVLDVMLPERDGFEICTEIRQRGSTVPILILSARADEVDRIAGLGLGADDYLVKPFSPRELVARVAALLRRAEIGPRPPEVVRAGNVELLLREREVRVAGVRVAVPRREFALLAAMLGEPDRVFDRTQLLTRLHDTDLPASGERTVDVHVARVRDKLRATHATVRITTVRGVGYKLECVAPL
jgi:DNA-binding response OmpR family regulator